jgi:hypothetical protein
MMKEFAIRMICARKAKEMGREDAGECEAMVVKTVSPDGAATG